MNLNLSQLITQILGGNRQAFEVLIRHYQKLVYGFAFQRTKNFADAEDLTQEAFLQTYQNLHTLREPEKFAGWMRGITFHLCDRWLKERRRVVLVDDVE